MAQSKLELILEMKNRMKAGLAGARSMVSGKVQEIKKDISGLKGHTVKAVADANKAAEIKPKVAKPDTGGFLGALRAARLRGEAIMSGIGSRIRGAFATSGNPFAGLTGQASAFGQSAVKAFAAARDEIPGLSRGLELITNKYVLMAAAVVGLAAGLGSATLKAADFNHSFLDVRQLNLDKSNQVLDGYRQKVLDTAFDTGISAQKMATGFYDIQSGLGLFGEDVAKINNRLGDFSVATKADFTESVNGTIKAMAAFKFGVNDLDKYLASNAKTVQVGITTFKDLAAVQTEYAGAAASANQNFDTANKLFASFTKVGKDSAMSANMVKTAFQGITQKTTIEGFKKMGVSLFDSKGQMRDLTAVITEAVPKIKAMSDFEFSKLRNEIGGPEGLQSLFNQMRTDGQGMIDVFKAFDGSSFNIDDALKNAKGDFNTLKDIVGNRFNVVMIELGTHVLPVVARGLEFVNTTIQALRGFLTTYSSEIKTFFTILKQTAMGVAGAFLLIKLPAIAAFLAIKAGAIASSIASFGLAGALNAVKLAFFSIPIIGWLAAAIAGFVTLYHTVDTFKAGVDGVLNVFKELLKLAKPLGEILIGIATNNYAKMADGFKNFREAWNTVDIAGAYRKGYDESMKAIKAEREKSKVDPATSFDAAAAVTPGAEPAGSTFAGVSSLEGNKQVRNITVNLEALHKGDNILHSQQVGQSTSLEEFQRMMEAYAMRLIRNIETSQG